VLEQFIVAVDSNVKLRTLLLLLLSILCNYYYYYYYYLLFCVVIHCILLRHTGAWFLEATCLF